MNLNFGTEQQIEYGRQTEMEVYVVVEDIEF